MMEKYFIAVKKGKEKQVNPNWPESLRGISSIELINNFRNKRILIAADQEGVGLIKNELSSDQFHIEHVIEHDRT